MDVGLNAAVVSWSPQARYQPPMSGFSVHLPALCLMTGVAIALAWTQRRWRHSGRDSHQVLLIAICTLGAGVLGGHIAHAFAEPGWYFGSATAPLRLLRMWDGETELWGALVLGALGAWWSTRLVKASWRHFVDASAPCIPAGLAVGRWGEYFDHQSAGQSAILTRAPAADLGHGVTDYLPADLWLFVYESLWNLALVGALLALSRRLRRPGQLGLALIVGYAPGQALVEILRLAHPGGHGFSPPNTVISTVSAAIAAIAMMTASARDRRQRHFRASQVRSNA